MYAPIIIDELKMEDFLNPTKKGLTDSIKNKYYNWNSEYNIKKSVRVDNRYHLVQNIQT